MTTEIASSLWQINRGPELIQIETPVVVLTTIVVFLRISLALSRRIGLGYDGWLILLALVLLWVSYTITVLMVKLSGLGRPLVVNMAIDENRITICLKFIFVGEFVYMTLINTIKFSILSFYIRLFPTIFMRRACYLVAAILTAWWTAVALVTVFQCHPVQKVYSPEMSTGSCIDQTKFYKAMIIPNIITDLIVFCLPVVEVRKLHLPRSQRIGLASVFLFGSVAIAVSVVRLWYNLKLVAEGQSDLTLSMFDSVVWTMLESALGMLAACLPAMRSLVLCVSKTPIFQKVNSYFSDRKSTGETDKDVEESQALEQNLTIGGTALPTRDRSENMRKLTTPAVEQTMDVSGYGETGGIDDSVGSLRTCSTEHAGYDPFEICPECFSLLQSGGAGIR